MRMIKALLVMMGLMGCLPSLAAESLRSQASQSITADHYVGTWLVVPRVKPNTAPPGEVPRIFFITKQGAALKGTFHWFDHDFALTNFAFKGDVLGFTVDFRDKPFKQFAKISMDGKRMDGGTICAPCPRR